MGWIVYITARPKDIVLTYPTDTASPILALSEALGFFVERKLPAGMVLTDVEKFDITIKKKGK